MTVKITAEVRDANYPIGVFVKREDAERFAAQHPSMFVLPLEIEIEWHPVKPGRKNLDGDTAQGPGEVIGYW